MIILLNTPHREVELRVSNFSLFYTLLHHAAFLVLKVSQSVSFLFPIQLKLLVDVFVLFNKIFCFRIFYDKLLYQGRQPPAFMVS